ncbi:MAG TPA: cell division protein FtsZ, partial [Dongiaceae bacterium]|nr:cell division protein FtsZ [Dongiaceae bacterium]
MTLNLSIPNAPFEIKPRITVIGVGGAGGNAVTNMIKSNLEGVEFVVTNTDSQALSQSLCERRIQLGVNITQGLGAGSRPDIGRAATEEALDEIIEQLQGSNMVFITAGMGGGTGTGGAPVIARAAREHGVLTVGVVTKPFHFEGLHRMRIAESGIQELQQFVDTLIIIPNQNLFRVANEKTTFADAFNMADEVLHSGVRGVTDLMVMPGLINLDFADIRAVMTEMGKAMMGTGEAEGENRAVAAAEAAISNPLLDDVSMKGARGVLINITGGLDMTLFEVDEAANRIRDEVDPDANIIFGSTFNPSLEGRVRISVVATGIDSEAVAAPRPATLSLVAKGGRVMSAPMTAEPAEATAAAPIRAEWDAAPAAEAVPLARAVGDYRDERSAVAATAPASPEAAPRRAPESAVPEPVERRAPAFAEARTSAPRAAAQPTFTARAPAPRAERPAPSWGEADAAAPAAAPRRRSPNLFARVTGGAAAWARQTSTDLREATPSAMMERGAGTETASRPDDEPAPKSATAPAPAQTRLA